MKKLDKTICKGGMFGKKEVLGIMFASKSNRHYIYESTGPSYLNIFTIEIPTWQAHQLTLFANDNINGRNENTYIPRIDWGGGELITDSSGNKIFKHYYNNYGATTPWIATIRTTCEPQFYIGSNPQVDNFPGEYVKDVVSIRTDYLNGNSLFYGYKGIKTIREPVLLRLNTSVFFSMSSMFAYCSSMEILDLSSFNTSNVEIMSYMFFDCSSLTQLNLSNFDTSKVWDVSDMFSGCTSLVKLNLSNFNLDNVNPNGYGMANFLANCDSLQELRLDNCNYDTINKILTCYGGTHSFPTGDIGVERKIYCKAENKGDLEAPDGWVFSYVTEEEPEVPEEPEEPRPIYGVDIETFSLSDDKTLVHTDVLVDERTYYLSYMFSNCTNLKSVNTKGWDTRNVVDMCSMFSNCESLVTLDINNFNTSKVTDTSWMFSNCKQLTSLDLSKWHTSKITNMYMMFSNCKQLASLNLSNWDVSNVTNTQSMFRGCTFTELDLSGWYTLSATDMDHMFMSCTNLEVLDIRNFKAPSVGQTERMFEGCNKLRVIRMNNCDNAALRRFIVNQDYFPGYLGDNTGIDRVIYCPRASVYDKFGGKIEPPQGWRFEFVD